MFTLLLDPNVAYVMLVIGFVLAILALFSPGTGILEIGAVFSLVLAGYSIFNLPINFWALLILILGVFPFILALKRSRHWAFLVLSIIALIIGTLFIFRVEDRPTAIHPLLAIFVSAVAGGIFWFVAMKSIEAIEQKPAFDLQQLIGAYGLAKTDLDPDGSVYVRGEEWSAHSDQFVKAGETVKVTRREGLKIYVEVLKPEANVETQHE